MDRVRLGRGRRRVVAPVRGIIGRVSETAIQLGNGLTAVAALLSVAGTVVHHADSETQAHSRRAAGLLLLVLALALIVSSIERRPTPLDGKEVS